MSNNRINYLMKIFFFSLPPVTSHIASIGDESLATKPVSLSTAGVPDKRSTKENNLWSHLNGSLVSSDPGIGECIGSVNCNNHFLFSNYFFHKKGKDGISTF